MISEEKMNHIINLILRTLGREGFVEFIDESSAMREAKRVGNQYINDMASVSALARRRIETQQNPPPEHSQQWSVLYQKYFEEELRKKGG